MHARNLLAAAGRQMSKCQEWCARRAAPPNASSQASQTSWALYKNALVSGGTQQKGKLTFVPPKFSNSLSKSNTNPP